MYYTIELLGRLQYCCKGYEVKVYAGNIFFRTFEMLHARKGKLGRKEEKVN